MRYAYAKQIFADKVKSMMTMIDTIIALIFSIARPEGAREFQGSHRINYRMLHNASLNGTYRK